MIPKTIFLAAILAASCASLPSDPQVLGDQIIADLDAGMVAQAQKTFDRVGGDSIWRESLYPVFYTEAQRRYEEGDFEGASTILRFSVAEYSGASSLREALIFSLFQLRANAETVDPSLVQELQMVVQGFIEAGSYSSWADLIAAQTAIDLGQTQDAIAPYQRFLAIWDGQPAELETYVQDIGRYLENPPSQGEEKE
jgi:hypothetical protein